MPIRLRDRALLDGQALALALRIDPSTIRAWASAGLITRHGRDGRRVLYDVDEVERVSLDGATGVRALRALRSRSQFDAVAQLCPEPEPNAAG